MAKKKPKRPARARQPVASRSHKDSVRLPFSELPNGVIQVRSGATSAHPVELADNLQKMLSRVPVAKREEALVQVFDKVFAATRKTLSAPSESSILVWPLLHQAFLPHGSDFLVQLAMTLHTLCATCSRLGADHLRNSNGVVATASLFPHVAGDLPSWRSLINRSRSAVAADKPLRAYVRLLLDGAVHRHLDSVSNLLTSAGYLPILETVVVRLTSLQGSKRLILVGFGQEPPSEFHQLFLEQSQVTVLLIGQAQQGKSACDAIRTFMRVGYPLVAETLHDLAYEQSPSSLPMREMLLGPGLLPQALQGMLGPFSVEGSDPSSESGSDA